METKQTPPAGSVLPRFDQEYGPQVITEYNFPEGGMSSGGDGTEIQSFDFPEPDTNPSNKALDPLDQVKAERKAKRRGKRAVNKANRFNKRNPNNQINVPGQTPPPPPPSSYDEDANRGGNPYYPGMGNNVGSGNSSLNMMDQQYDQQSPQGTVPMQNLMPDQTAMSYQPPMPGNTQGTAKPLFNQGTAAQQIYGSEEQRQQSVPGAPLYMHKGEPHAKRSLETYEQEKIRNSIDGDDASLFGKVKKILFKPTNQGVRVSDITKRSYDNFKEKIDPIGRYITEYPNKYL